jgi:RNA recognition motif-containing protein
MMDNTASKGNEMKENRVRSKHGSDNEKTDSKEAAKNTVDVSSLHTLKMLGLPFKATEHDIQEFFAPISIGEIRLITNKEERPSGALFSDMFLYLYRDCNVPDICEGRAFVDFSSNEDLQEALKRDKDYMGKEMSLDLQYVCLILTTESVCVYVCVCVFLLLLCRWSLY